MRDGEAARLDRHRRRDHRSAELGDSLTREYASGRVGTCWSVATELQKLGRRLVGEWTTEATHPQMPGVVVAGSSTFEWLDGECFVIARSHHEHPDFPNAVSIIGDTDGNHMHYFDSRGVYRLYALTMMDEGWSIAMGRDAPADSFASPGAPFSQRMTYCFEDADQKMSGKGVSSTDDVNWEDDLQITYQRVS